MLNPTSPNAAAARARQPRGMVKIMGSDGGQPTPIVGWVRWEVEANGHYSADTFRVTFAAQLLPKDRNLAWMLSQSYLNVEILAGFPSDPAVFDASQLTSLIIGRCDSAEFDPVHNSIELHGRDYTAALIDSKTTDTWKNKSVAQVVQALAARHGLTANVAALPTKVGTYSDIDHVRFTDERSEWDLLTWLAHETQCDVWVSGLTLNFQKQEDPAQQDYYLLNWQAADGISTFFPTGNVLDLRLAHNMTIAKGVQVVVRSWHGTFKNSFTASYPGKPKTIKVGKATPVSNTTTYTYNIPGLDAAGCLQKAQALYNAIVKQEMSLEARLPADNVLSVRTMVRLQGTGTAFDQSYYPSRVTRVMSVEEGYAMSISARNLSPSLDQPGEYGSPVQP